MANPSDRSIDSSPAAGAPAADPDDTIEIIEDDAAPGAARPADLPSNASVWEILVVDDDEEVQRGTAFSLSHLTILGRRLRCTQARSSAEAREILTRRRDFAVILLDVVMESEDAGLRLARAIRGEFGLSQTRIVLRTGQPGYAPEAQVIQDYDINDYRTKSELTQVRLVTSLTAALRSYQQIQTIEATRDGLRKIVEVSSQMFRNHMLRNFAEGIMSQICDILTTPMSGIVVVRRARSVQTEVVVAAAGSYADTVGRTVEAIPDQMAARMLRDALERGDSVFEPQALVLYVIAPSLEHPLDELRKQLLEIFSVNMTVGLHNASLFEQIDSLAFIDPLTQLANRNRFHQIVTKVLDQPTAADSRRASVFLVDLDGFQYINDGLGYEAGDQVLKLTARRLEGLIEEPDCLARLSADVFGLVRMGTDPDEEQRFIGRIQEVIAAPLQVANGNITVTASVGMCHAEPGEANAIGLIRKATMALAQAKKTAPGHARLFTNAMQEELNRRLTVIRQLGRALDTSQICVYFQPFIGLPPASSPGVIRRPVIGGEALLRWKQPDGSVLPPSGFIQAAEDSGIIVQLGEWVLREVCLRQVAWRDAGLAPLRLAVNVSIRQMRREGFIRRVDEIFRETGADPRHIELELTESLAMDETVLIENMHALHDLGVGLSIDDFGTGYSSLSRLRQLPADRLKVDQSFVNGIDTVPECETIVAMIVALGHELGMSIIAEGVETAAQEAALIRLGCEEAQGYLHFRPMPIEDVEAVLRARRD
jgi:diguanylate cyclase (GGDEF)-like protein